MKRKNKLIVKALLFFILTLLAIATVVVITVASTVWGNKQTPLILKSQGPTNVRAVLNILLIPTSVMITVIASNLSDIAKMWYTTTDHGLPLECWDSFSGLPGPWSAYKFIKHFRMNVLILGIPLFAVWGLMQGSNTLQNAGLQPITTLRTLSDETIVTTGNVSIQQYLNFPKNVINTIQNSPSEAYTITSQLNSYKVPTFVDGISQAQLTDANIENIGKNEVKTLYIPAYGAVINITHPTNWDTIKSKTVIEVYGPVVSIEMTCGPVYNGSDIANDNTVAMVVSALSESDIQSNNGFGVSLVAIYVNLSSLDVGQQSPIQLITALCTSLELNPPCNAIYTCFASATYDASCKLKLNATTNSIISKDNCQNPNVTAGKELLKYQISMLNYAGDSISNQTEQEIYTLLYQQLLFGGQNAVNAGVRPEGYATLLSTGIGAAGLYGDNTAQYPATIYIEVQQLQLILWANITLYAILSLIAILITICSITLILTAKVNIDADPTYFLLTKTDQIIGHNMQGNQNNDSDYLTKMHNKLSLVVRDNNGCLVAALNNVGLNGTVPNQNTYYTNV